MNRYCSFCGKNQQEVKTLIAGPSVNICEECVGACKKIMDVDRCVFTEEEARKQLQQAAAVEAHSFRAREPRERKP